jgi:hypothetical protein
MLFLLFHIFLSIFIVKLKGGEYVFKRDKSEEEKWEGI